jgi:hypothetical protein
MFPSVGEKASAFTLITNHLQNDLTIISVTQRQVKRMSKQPSNTEMPEGWNIKITASFPTPGKISVPYI